MLPEHAGHRTKLLSVLARSDDWQVLNNSREYEAVVRELQIELPEGHMLSGISVIPVARRTSSDDVLLAINDGSARLAEVRLTWRGSCEALPLPETFIFDGVEHWQSGD
jgi:hypothetical protein